MRFKRITEANKAKIAKLTDALRLASDNVYAAAAPRNDVPFRQCYEMASHTIRASYDRAKRALDDYENQMVAEGRAHRQNTFGTLQSY
jgi:argininosuccinate lyase